MGHIASSVPWSIAKAELRVSYSWPQMTEGPQRNGNGLEGGAKVWSGKTKGIPRGQGWRRQKKAQIVYQVPITSSGCEVTRREWVCSRWGLTEEQSWAMRDGWRWKWRKNQSPWVYTMSVSWVSGGCVGWGGSLWRVTSIPRLLNKRLSSNSHYWARQCVSVVELAYLNDWNWSPTWFLKKHKI